MDNADVTGDPLAEKEARDRREHWLRGETKAHQAELAWRTMAEELAEMLAELPQLTPWMPCLDPDDWEGRGWQPETGADIKAIRDHLLAALGGAYAYAGGYSTALARVNEALIADLHANVAPDAVPADDTQHTEPAGT